MRPHRSFLFSSGTQGRSVPGRSAGRRVWQRGAFTLIELMVVIGIIATLAGLVTFTMSTMVGSSKERATEATIRKIHLALRDRMESFDRAFQRNRQNLYGSNIFQTERRLLNDYGTNTIVENNIDDLSEMVTRKQLVRQMFPQTYAEAEGLEAPPGHDPVTESAELLYYIVTEKTERFPVPQPGNDMFNTSEVGDTDGDGRKEFLDAWGQPLRFYRWPTRLIRPAGTLPNGFGAPLNEAILVNMIPGVSEALLELDPDDPFLLMQRLYSSPQDMETNFHTPGTWHGVLIVSAGPDGDLGLYEPHDKDNLGHLAAPTAASLVTSGPEPLYDNITNRMKTSDAN